MAKFSPRIPQQEAMDACMQAWRNSDWKQDRKSRRLVVIMPTGTGKSGFYEWMAARAVDDGLRVLVIAHRDELLVSPCERDLPLWWPEHAKRAGIVKAARDDVKKDIVFASISTLATHGCRRLHEYMRHGLPGLIIIDECHHAPASTYTKVLATLEEAAIAARGKPPLVLGLTATPERTDGKELGDKWTLAYHYTLQRAWAEGYLVPRRGGPDAPAIVERIPDLDYSAADQSRFDGMSDEEVGEKLLMEGIVNHTVAMMNKHLRRPDGTPYKSIAFCANIKQVEETTAALEAAGWKARMVTGTTKDRDRKRLIKHFAKGRFDVLVNCGVLTEGFDDKEIRGVVCCRPFGSKSLYLQSVGRGMRICPGKEWFMELDLVGASVEHSLVTANVLLTPDEEEASGKGSSSYGSGAVVTAPPDPLQGLFRERRAFDDFDWVDRGRVQDRSGRSVRARLVFCGKHGVLVALGYPGGMWRPLHVKGAKVTELSSTLVSAGWSDAVAADLARRAKKQTRATREEEELPSTLAQRAKLKRMGLSADNAVSRQVADQMIAVEGAMQALVAKGIITRQRPRQTRISVRG